MNIQDRELLAQVLHFKDSNQMIENFHRFMFTSIYASPNEILSVWKDFVTNVRSDVRANGHRAFDYYYDVIDRINNVKRGSATKFITFDLRFLLSQSMLENTNDVEMGRILHDMLHPVCDSIDPELMIDYEKTLNDCGHQLKADVEGYRGIIKCENMQAWRYESTVDVLSIFKYVNDRPNAYNSSIEAGRNYIERRLYMTERTRLHIKDLYTFISKLKYSGDHVMDAYETLCGLVHGQSLSAYGLTPDDDRVKAYAAIIRLMILIGTDRFYALN